MRRLLPTFFLLAGFAAFVASGCGDGGKQTVHNLDDARNFVSGVLEGKGLDEFKLADDALPVARAAVDDSAALSTFRARIAQAPDETCEIAGYIDAVGDLSPDSPDPVVVDQQDAFEIYSAAESAGYPDGFTAGIIDLASQMAQSTWIEAVDNTCTAAEGF